MSLDVSIQPDDTATLTVHSPLGQRVTFDVRQRRIRGAGAERFIVGLKGSDGQGFSQHTTFDTAFRAALSRARRYDRSLAKAAKRKGVAA
jgi:hypothetical protein